LETDNAFEIDKEEPAADSLKKSVVDLKINPTRTGKIFDPDHDPTYVKAEKYCILYPNSSGL
jgi:hypothetical protein